MGTYRNHESIVAGRLPKKCMFLLVTLLLNLAAIVNFLQCMTSVAVAFRHAKKITTSNFSSVVRIEPYSKDL